MFDKFLKLSFRFLRKMTSRFEKFDSCKIRGKKGEVAWN
jgi:hypothetical protein